MTSKLALLTLEADTAFIHVDRWVDRLPCLQWLAREVSGILYAAYVCWRLVS